MRNGLVPVVVILALSVTAACSDGASDASGRQPPTGDSRDERSSAPLRVDAPYGEVDLRGLVAISDVVVAGTVVAVDRIEMVGPEKNLTVAVVEVDVDEVLHGDVPGSVRIAHVTAVRGKAFKIPDLPVPSVGTDGVWLVVALSSQFGAEGYVPSSVSSQILFDNDGRVVPGVRAPVVPRGRQEAEELGTREKVLERLRS